MNALRTLSCGFGLMVFGSTSTSFSHEPNCDNQVDVVFDVGEFATEYYFGNAIHQATPEPGTCFVDQCGRVRIEFLTDGRIVGVDPLGPEDDLTTVLSDMTALQTWLDSSGAGVVVAAEKVTSLGGLTCLGVRYESPEPSLSLSCTLTSEDGLRIALYEFDENRHQWCVSAEQSTRCYSWLSCEWS